ncbi:MAG TPA: glycosyltransferase [Flavobacteriales bacterium]|nr:glycosyltransferase [Flavobacteriales bacterium]
MKIAFLSTFYPYRGGIAQFNANLYREMEKKHTVKAFNFTRQYPNFLFPGKTQYVEEKDIADKIETIRCLDSINPFTWSKTAKLIKKENPDILFSRLWMSFFGPSLGYVNKRVMKNGSTVVSILDNVIPHEKRFFDKPFTKYYLKHNHGFLAMNEAVKNDLLSYVPNARVIVRPHPLYSHFGQKKNKAEAQKQLGLDPTKKTLLFFGLIRDYKGLDNLIKAFGMLDNSYQLIIAGESYGDFKKYQDEIDKIPYKQNIKTVIEYIDDNRVTDFFSAADVVVLPYRTATQSGITAIAYHFNLPVIATNVGGLEESILDEKTGLIIRKNYPVDIAAVIKRFYSSPFDYNSDIHKLKEELSWSRFSNDLVDFAVSLKK